MIERVLISLAATVLLLAPASAGPAPLSPAQLSAMAHLVERDPGLPLGDRRFSLTTPAVGLIYLCHPPEADGPGAGRDGPWITGATWRPARKLQIGGDIAWPNAALKVTEDGGARLIKGNGLPVSHTTGRYPVAPTDPAHAYDANPNSISPQSMLLKLPINPVYQDRPRCIGGEVGVMLTGVPLFNGFDATGRDAAAHEAQDLCDGHPQNSGQYHYHSLSRCLSDVGVATVIGFAFDGFPITGPVVAPGKELRTADLDECHGLTSEVALGGKPVATYHYVMTRDFPYSVSCFRGRPATMFAVAPWWRKLLGE